MSADVFLSYSSRDKLIADAVCSRLEQEKVRCWVAPRDIRPGEDWGNAIIRGITQSRMMVLIFSANANQSRQVLREVERAVSLGKTIIPFRIDESVPTGGMEYFMATLHWLDALTPPLERHIDRLNQEVRALIDLPTRDHEKAGVVGHATARSHRSIWLAAGFAATIAVILAGWLLLRDRVAVPPVLPSIAGGDPFLKQIDAHDKNIGPAKQFDFSQLDLMSVESWLPDFDNRMADLRNQYSVFSANPLTDVFPLFFPMILRDGSTDLGSLGKLGSTASEPRLADTVSGYKSFLDVAELYVARARELEDVSDRTKRTYSDARQKALIIELRGIQTNVRGSFFAFQKAYCAYLKSDGFARVIKSIRSGRGYEFVLRSNFCAAMPS